MTSQVIKRRVKQVVLWLEVIFILIVGAGVGVVLGAFYQMNKLLPPDAALDAYRAPVGTKIYSSDNVLLAKLAVENREPVPMARIPKQMQDAIVSIEDSRFYQHSGLDYRGLVRAVVANVAGHEMSQGASTITQQLARNIFLDSRKKISRKIKEMLLAIQIERNWTKKQILEAYLNQVYFGSGAYGIKAAAQVYFNKDVGKLTLEEAALLAGLPQSPSRHNPFAVYDQDHNYNRTKSRRDDVLTRMAELGYITPDVAAKAKAKPIKVAKRRPALVGFFKAKYFVRYVVDQLQKQYDQDLLDKAGLTVVTTLNWKMQQAAEKAASEGLAKYKGWGKVSETSLVCIDPATGYIRAMVGGVHQPWEKYQFNCATQARRQPGSSFKLFVYLAALEAGKTPYSTVNANASVLMPDGKYYTPHNHGKASGRMSYESAFASSVNGAAVNVLEEAGPKNVVALAQKKFGLTGRLYAYPSLALGVCDVSVLEMASAYGAIAAGGKRAEPMTILKVLNQENEPLQDFHPQVTDLKLQQSSLDGINELTRAVVEYGTGRGAASVPDAHGKTGTTEDNTDAWFCGYVPGGLATAVWAGNRNNKPMSQRLFGGTICAPIWAEFMNKALAISPPKKPAAGEVAAKPKERRRREHPRPTPTAANGDDDKHGRVRVRICTESGQLATRNCPSTERQEFLAGEQPLSRCSIHGGSRGDKEKKDPPETPAPETPEKEKDKGDGTQ